MPLAIAACVALAALSLLLPSAPSADAWAWIVWGREVLHLDLDTTNASSWKPLPVVFTTPFALAGDAAPELWLVAARAGGLLAVVMAYRLAARFAGPAAGLVAAVALLSADWLRFVAHGESEPLLAALLLWAVERHLDGRPDHALVLGFLAALGRPEVWPFYGLYCAWLWVSQPERRRAVASLTALAAVIWLGGDWWGSGNPLEASERANTPTPTSLSTADHPAISLIGRALRLVIAPVLVAAAAGTAFAVLRRELAALVLTAAGAAWVAIVAVMTELGYTGNERYLFPVTAAICVLAGVGAVRLATAAGGRWTLVVAALMLAATAPFAVKRERTLERHARAADERADIRSGLESAVKRAGGPRRLLDCGHPAVTRGGFQGALAWQLDVPLSDVERPDPPVRALEVRLPAVVFDAPKGRLEPAAAAASDRSWRGPGLRQRLVARGGAWSVYAVSRGPTPTECPPVAPRALRRVSPTSA